MLKEKDGMHKEKSKQLYCSNCSSGITQDTKLDEDKNGVFRGNCTCCKKEDVIFIDKLTGVKKAKHPMDAKAEQKKKELELEKQQEEEMKKKWAEDSEEGLKQEEQGIKDFEDPDLLLKIKEELDKDHVGDDKAKLFIFACACSTQLRPEDRFSTAITGEKAEGKDNLWKTVYRHLPDGKGWFLDLTRSTTASLEDDIKDYNGLYFGEGNFEGGANAPIRDTIKQLVEDGISVLKKDKRKDNIKSRHEKHPRIVGIYSTTAQSDDEELASRFCITSVHGSPGKYKLVNEYTKTIAGNVDLQIDQTERKEIPTWIRNGLIQLQKFDFVDIPYAPVLEVESRDSRSQRDFKRFLSLIRSLAWICQRNRIQYEHRGYKILVTDIEDFYNAVEIGKEIFDQSLSGMDPRLRKVIESLQKVTKERPEAIATDLEGEDTELCWVDRSAVQEDLEIKTRDTIISRVKKLADMGILAYCNRGSRSHIAFKKNISASNLPSNYPLITVDQNELYDYIKSNENDILKEILDGKSTLNSTLPFPDKKISSNLLSLETSHRRKSSKNVDKTHELSIIMSLKQKFDGKISTVSKNKKDHQKTLETVQQEKKGLLGKITEVKEYCLKVQKKGSYPSYAALIDHFDENTIFKLIESSQLIKIPKTDCYRWGDS